MQKIGVMGGQGSFSEEAGNYYCQKNKIKEYELGVIRNLAGLDLSKIS